jgi:hypothetical protein
MERRAFWKEGWRPTQRGQQKEEKTTRISFSTRNKKEGGE